MDSTTIPITPGRRVRNTDLLAPGDYGKHPFNGVWYCRAPVEGHMTANLERHDVIEHADGTITVSPSILITKPMNGLNRTWHGFLENGIWREC